MKIKLKSSSEKARELARCLVGSKALWDSKRDGEGIVSFESVSITGDGVLSAVVGSYFLAAGNDWFDELFLPVESLKLNPYLAMQYGVPVADKTSVYGHIVALKDYVGDLKMMNQYTGYFVEVPDDLTISIDYYRTANIEGIEIIDEGVE